MKPTPRDFEPHNQELQWRIGLIRYCLTGAFGNSPQAFREQLQALYRWTWGTSFKKLEPGVWVSRKTTGIVRKGKNAMRSLDNRHLVVVDHQLPVVVQFSLLKDKNFTSNQAIYDWLVQNNRVVHIHIDEDDELSRRGWRDRKRPPDAYLQVGIEVYFVENYDRNKPIP